MRKVIYPGSFDPITKLNLDMIERGQAAFQADFGDAARHNIEILEITMHNLLASGAEVPATASAATSRGTRSAPSASSSACPSFRSCSTNVGAQTSKADCSKPSGGSSKIRSVSMSIPWATQ